MAVNLTNAQKSELRRLTQFANRRILAVAREYQIKEKWHTSKTPISRSVKFDSMADYRRQINKLRSYEVQKDDIWTYTRVQKEKTLQAMETALGREVPPDLANKVNGLTAAKLSDFWNTFSNRASRLGTQYSSNSAMVNAMEDYFQEDIDNLLKV